MSSLNEIRVPSLGNITKATIIEIAVQVGSPIQLEDTLITLESEKAAIDIPASSAGIVKAVKIKIGDSVSPGDVIVLVEPTESNTISSTLSEATRLNAVSQQSHKTHLENTTLDHQIDDAVSIHAGPGVRLLARELGIDLKHVKATGLKGRILKEDLQQFVKTRLAQKSQVDLFDELPAAPSIDFSTFGPVEKKALSRIKKLSASFLHRNWLSAPHVTQFDEADITELDAFRQYHQSQLLQSTATHQSPIKLTLLTFIIKATVTVLKRFPQLNASLSDDGKQLIIKQYYNIGIAVDTPEGLVVPVIRAADQKGLVELATELSTLSSQARKGQLSPEAMQGSSFTISSLGGIGGGHFTPIVKLPDVAILGISKAALKPVWQAKQFVPRLLLPLSVSYDHRVIDGAEGARFMFELVNCLSDIRKCLL